MAGSAASGYPSRRGRRGLSPTAASTSAARAPRVPYVALFVTTVSAAFLALWRTGFWGPFEPRVLEIAREQYVANSLLRVPTFSGMTFLEKPALYYDLLAMSFHLVGAPSVTAARLVHGALLLLWVVATMLVVRRAAGPRAALLAGGLVASSNLFIKLAGRISIDGALAASLTLSLVFLARALSSGRGRIPAGPWLLGLAFGGVAFWTKGFLGSFLFGAPLLVYAAWARDRRVILALLRPTSILVLLAPVALWSVVLYAHGGETFLFEAFVNNTLGRFVNHRFVAAGIETLEYGDVNGPSEPWLYLARLPSLAGASFLLLPFAVHEAWRNKIRERGPRARLLALALCFALVPPILLSFSSQKGVHHLGSCTTGFAVAGALWFHRHAVRRDRRDAPAWTTRACAGVAWLAPVLLVGALLGFPSTLGLAIGVGVVVCVAGLATAVLVARAGSRRLAAHCALTVLILAAIVSRSPGGTDDEDLQFTAFPEWVHAEIGSRQIGLYGAGESDLGVFCWSMQAEHDALRDLDEVTAYLLVDTPRYVVTRAPAHEEVTGADASFQVIAVGGNGDRE